jgi:uncharacterized membrane protein (UPF0127 family)
MDALQFYRLMARAVPGWYEAIDGFNSHAYPNPGFTASPLSQSRYGITSYRYELNLLKSLGYSGKPVFITETGYVGKDEFYKTAFESVWQENNIVAITPFVLFAGAGNFTGFSLTDLGHQPKSTYLAIYALVKTNGSPLLNPPPPDNLLSVYSFPSAGTQKPVKNDFIQKIKDFIFPPPPQLTVGNTTITVDIASTPASREQGLSYRKSLNVGSGMLFTFPAPGVQLFWMKGMNFALDFIWINKNQVVNLNENIPPPYQTGGSPMIISSVLPVNQVLEVNAGFIKSHSIKVGDQVMLNSP